MAAAISAVMVRFEGPEAFRESRLGLDRGTPQRRLRRRPTLMFNGYGDQVAQLYAGMDLKKTF
jgi:hypothetical protein